jgi:hypothetical protein
MKIHVDVTSRLVIVVLIHAAYMVSRTVNDLKDRKTLKKLGSD